MMSNPNTSVTLIEAAKLLGVSSQTVRRLIHRKTLPASQSLGPHGLRWEIQRADLARYLEANNATNNANTQGQQPLSGHDFNNGQQVNADPNTPTMNPNEAAADNGQRVDAGQQPQQAVPLKAHLAALDLARSQLDQLQHQAQEFQQLMLQAERGKMAAEVQLSQYQRILTESAQSLAEERALRMSLEIEKQLNSIPPPPIPEVQPTTSTPTPGWGRRFRRWLGIEQTG